MQEDALIAEKTREKAWSWEEQSKKSRTQSKDMGIGEVWKYFPDTDPTYSQGVRATDKVQLHPHLNISQLAKVFSPQLGR